MKMQYFGTRGSIPAPGPETVRYGGNTSSVSIEAGGEQLILDAGSGIRKLGLGLMAREYGKGQGKAHVFVSHMHGDHVHGWPFFVPVYIRGNEFHLYGDQGLGKTLEEVIEQQQRAPHFPDGARFMADLTYHTLKEWDTVNIEARDGSTIAVTNARLNHPAPGVYAYRIEHGGRSIVYATDTEHYSEPDWKLVKLAQDADLLIYDSQYTPEEYPQKVSWGHSTYAEGAKVAQLARVKELHLFHHDPEHSDEFLENNILLPAQELFANTYLAQEGRVHVYEPLQPATAETGSGLRGGEGA